MNRVVALAVLALVPLRTAPFGVRAGPGDDDDDDDDEAPIGDPPDDDEGDDWDDEDDDEEPLQVAPAAVQHRQRARVTAQ